tara:strand:- start:5885 stop:6481 length:597 start_codon:yes stop_codon:yes gene_type:complete
MINIFNIPIQVTKIDFDFTELRKDKRHVYIGQEKKSMNDSSLEKVRILKKYPKLEKLLLKEIHTYTGNLGIQNKYIISTSWLTIVERGEIIDNHTHNNSQFSGVLYYGTDYIDAEPLNLVNPFIAMDGFELKIRGKQEYFANCQVVPNTGVLIIFPSFIEHFANRNKINTRRKSLAFNIFPTGKIGQGDGLIDTEWFK